MLLLLSGKADIYDYWVMNDTSENEAIGFPELVFIHLPKDCLYLLLLLLFLLRHCLWSSGLARTAIR